MNCRILSLLKTALLILEGESRGDRDLDLAIIKLKAVIDMLEATQKKCIK